MTDITHLPIVKENEDLKSAVRGQWSASRQLLTKSPRQFVQKKKYIHIPLWYEAR